MDARTPFLRLDDFLLPPPLPALVASLIVLGLVDLGARLAQRLSGSEAADRADRAERAAGFVLTAGLLGAAAHAVAWANLWPSLSLRGLGWALAAWGAVRLPAAAGAARAALAA